MKSSTNAGRIVLVLVGVPLASCLSALAPGCVLVEGCPKDPLVRDVTPATYLLDRTGPRTEIGTDADYKITVSADRSTVIEEFTRNGRKHRHEYAARPAVASPLRSNRSND